MLFSILIVAQPPMIPLTSVPGVLGTMFPVDKEQESIRQLVADGVDDTSDRLCAAVCSTSSVRLPSGCTALPEGQA